MRFLKVAIFAMLVVVLAGCAPRLLTYATPKVYTDKRGGEIGATKLAGQFIPPKGGAWYFWQMPDGKIHAELLVVNDNGEPQVQTGTATADDISAAAKQASLDPANVVAQPTGEFVGEQYRDTGWFGILFTYTIIFFVLYNIVRAGKGKDLFIRRIAGLNAIDEAIGRATEMGRPVVMVPGLSTLNAVSVQALNIFAYISRTAARFANPIRLLCGDAAVYTVAQEIIRDTYQQEGLIDRFDQDSVRFVSDRQFAFAAGVSGLILREQVAAAFFMGDFFAESLIFAETANSVGAIQVASSTQITQIPFFIAACDYVLIGDEFYAASAYLTREPVLVGSLIGQDWAKVLIAAYIVLGTITGSVLMGNPASGPTMMTEEWKDGVWSPLIDSHGMEQPREAEMSDTFLSRLLNPSPNPNVKAQIIREEDPIAKKVAELKASAGGGE